MTTAIIEAPETEVPADQLEEFFARQHQIDAAIRRKAARQQTAGDVMVLETYNLTGIKFDTELGRINGVDSRLKTAGSAKEYAAAQKHAAETAKKFQGVESVLTPQIADLEKQLADARQELRTAKDNRTAAEAVLSKMDTSRLMLRDRLLPTSFQEMLGVMARPVRQRFAPLLAVARSAVSAASGRIMTGIDGGTDPGVLADAEAELKRLEAQQAAEISQVGMEIRNFYLD